MTSLPNDSVALSQILAGSRLPLSAALYACGEVARLVAAEHDLGRSVTGLDADHIHCTGKGALVLGGTRVDRADLKADVRAVGALFYRLLTGKSPAAKDVVAPSHFNPGVDSELDAVILAALAHDASQRPASLRVLEEGIAAVFEELELEPSAQELADVVAKVPRKAVAVVKAAPPPAVKRVPLPVKRVPPPVIKRAPPTGWYASESTDEDDEVQSTSNEVPTWQVQARERNLKVGVSAAMVLVALLWALWPAPKASRSSFDDDAPRAKVTSRR